MPLFDLYTRASTETEEWTMVDWYGTKSPQFTVETDCKLTLQDVAYHTKGVFVYPHEKPELYKLVRVLDPNWREREQRRFKRERGGYTPLPWPDLEPIADHFAHVSLTDGIKVAYTPDEAKGQADIQVLIRPGKYLTKFYPHLSADEVRDLAVALDKASGMRIARTADDIEEVYLKGPNSCMSHELSDYASEVHPVRAYGDSDLSVAYLANVAVGEEGFKASARAVIWEAKKLFVRVYGDTHRLGAVLRTEGYTQADGFDGAKLAKIQHKDKDNAWVLPYLDGNSSVDIRLDHVLIVGCGNGDYEADSTSGVVGEQGENYCEYMEQYTDEDLTFITDLDILVCTEAYERLGCWECYGTGNIYSQDTSRQDIGWRSYSEDHLEDHGFYCEGSNRWYLADEESSVFLEDTAETVSLTYAEANCYHDAKEGMWYFEAPKADDAPEAS